MSKLACLGGKPVVKNILENAELHSRADLERKYLLETYDSGIWNDWPGAKSTAAKFQDEWRDFCNAKYCTLLTNGTHTLQVALETLDIGFGDEVIVPGLTWQATASAVIDVNAVPVLVDVDPETLCIDANKIEQFITPRTKAIIPVHLYHRMADMDKIKKIVKKHKLYLIEDCAHVHGSQFGGVGAGSLGDFGSFSFQQTKLMTSGEGGALTMQTEENFYKAISLRSCGREYKPGVRVHSGNFRMTSLQAAILRGQLAAMKKNAPIIDRNGLALDKAIDAAPGVRSLRRNPQINRMCGYGFVFLFDTKAYDGLSGDAFRKALSAELGFDFETTYTPLSHSELYSPEMKRRHHISKSYLKEITPSRWKLPVADDLWKTSAVKAHWTMYKCPPKKAKLFTDAITKIYENRHELLKK